MTDRVTGETLVRGEAKRLRRNIVTLEQRIKVLEEENQLLRPYADAYHRWQAPQYQVRISNVQLSNSDMELANSTYGDRHPGS